VEFLELAHIVHRSLACNLLDYMEEFDVLGEIILWRESLTASLVPIDATYIEDQRAFGSSE
jgi:hypothetical protein